MKLRHYMFFIGLLLLFCAPLAGIVAGDWALLVLFVVGALLFVSGAAIIVPHFVRLKERKQR